MGRKANLDKDEVIPEGKKKKKKRQGARRLMKCQAVKDHSEHWQKKKPKTPQTKKKQKTQPILFEDCYIIIWRFECAAFSFPSNWEVLIKYFWKMCSCATAIHKGIPVIQTPHLKIMSKFYFPHFKATSVCKFRLENKRHFLINKIFH